jgi:succinylglutamic semialdehyde dehydrogenase
MQSIDPASGKIIWEGLSAIASDVEKSVKVASMAFPKWSQSTLENRIHYLKAFAELLSSSKQTLAETISLETGKPLWESKGEVTAMISKIAITIEAYHKRCPEIELPHPNGVSMTRHKPHGVVAVFGPFNFPGHLPNGHIVPALLAGNTVIFKPSEYTPLTAERTVEIWNKSGLPEGCINVLQGGAETGQLLAAHPKINGIFFTGSWKVGKILSTQFAEQPNKILALEMGGNNPLVVGTITDLKAAAYTIVQSAYLTSGQRCTCARRLIIPSGEQGDALIKQLIAMIQTIKIGSYQEIPEPFMGPVINERAALQLLQAQQALQAKGGRALLEMKHLKKGTGFLSPGLMDVTLIDNPDDEEIFGPFLQLIRVKNFELAVTEANNTKFGLSAGLLSEKKEEYDIFFHEIHAGIVNWNQPLTGASSAAPFGGVGKSGNHRPSAFYAADYCSYPVASLETSNLALPATISPGVSIEI